MSLALLPPELLDAIFKPLTQSTLAAIARTNRVVGPSATRLLYRHISVSTYAHNLCAVHTLAVRPDLASLVRSFSISLDDADPVFHAFYVLLKRALQSMEDLTDLRLLVDSNAGWLIDNDVMYSRLQHFACSFPIDSSFLTRTPLMLSLELTGALSHFSLPPHAIPALESYAGPSSLLTHILPGRPVTSLLLSGDLTLDDVAQVANAHGAPDVSAACHTPAPLVVALTAVTSAPPALVLDALASTFPDLVCLRLLTTHAFWDSSDMAFYSRIAATLSTLPRLSAFELSGMHWESRPKLNGSLDDKREQEWISPPVTPRPAADADVELDAEPRDFDFDEAFQDWSY